MFKILGRYIDRLSASMKNLLVNKILKGYILDIDASFEFPTLFSIYGLTSGSSSSSSSSEAEAQSALENEFDGDDALQQHLAELKEKISQAGEHADDFFANVKFSRHFKLPT